MTYEQALHKTAALCTASERCVSEIEEKLHRWGFSESDSERLVSQLIENKFIDEKRFAPAFVRDKFRFNKWGRVKIAYALKQKRISSALITLALEEIEDEAYLTTLKELLSSKLKGLKYKDAYDKQAKLFRFAQSRGFELDAIQFVFKNLNE